MFHVWRVTIVVIIHKNTNFIGNNNRFAKDHRENKRGNDILAVRKVGHLNIKTKMFDFEARVLIGLQVKNIY